MLAIEVVGIADLCYMNVFGHTDNSLIIPMPEFSPGENYCQFNHLFSLAKFFYHVNFLSCVKDCIEDNNMVTFTVLAKLVSTNFF